MQYAFAVSVLATATVALPLYCFAALFVALFIVDLKQSTEVLKWLSFAALTHFGLWRLALLLAQEAQQLPYPANYAVALYSLTIALYHCAEYLTTAYFHPSKTNWESFLLNQSWHYAGAMCASITELGLRLYFGWYYQMLWQGAFLLGVVCVVIGQTLRIGAEINAGVNFTHQISYKKQDSHELVTSGFYRLCRHPSYFGWFLWSVGTQVMLCSPVCTVLYFLASRSFFMERIENEEEVLCHFFRNHYILYMHAVPAFPRGFGWLISSIG